jgi:hypothetical protein
VRTLDSRGGTALGRDLRLLLRMGVMVIGYWTVGARLRRAYRRCQARGEVLWLDAEGPARHRDRPLTR